MKDTTQNQFFNLDDGLCVALYKAQRLMNRTYSTHLSKLGLTYTQFLVMVCLWNKNNLSVKTISEKLELDSGTITPLLKRLMVLGHIKKSRSTADERVVLITLTELGEKLRDKAQNIPQDIFSALNMEMDEFLDIRHKVQNIIVKLSMGETQC